MKRVVFLDIDGVANSHHYLADVAFEKGAYDDTPEDMVDPWAVAQLNQIQRATHCAFVLSSSWRWCYRLKQVESFLRLKGFEGKLWQQTPIRGGAKHVTSTDQNNIRGAEIDLWLRRHAHLGPFSFVILDDNGGLQPHEDRWVQTTFAHGLTPALAARAIDMLLETPCPPIAYAPSIK